MVTYLPPTSAFARSVHGEKATWSTVEHLLAHTVDALNNANWQRGGGKGKRPKPVPRPGDEDRKASRTFGTGRMTIDAAQAFFDRINRSQEAQKVRPICEADGCDRPTRARSMCSKHYQRWWRRNR